MADVLTKGQRSYCMSRIRGRDTKPEVRLRKALWQSGLRYRVSGPLPGRPDVVFAGVRAVVFVDGCFWHRCPKHAVPPKSNGAFWRRKLRANVARDRSVDRKLHELGWRVIRVWEHEVEANPDEAAARVVRRLLRLRARSL